MKKNNLCDEFGFKNFEKVPFFLSFEKNEIIKNNLEGLKILNANFFIFDENKENEDYENIKFCNNKNDEMIKKVMACTDVLFVFDKNKQSIKDATKNQLALVSTKFGILENYNPVKETGNSFLYENSWEFFVALVRAVETYKFSYDWNQIVKNLNIANMKNVHRKFCKSS